MQKQNKHIQLICYQVRLKCAGVFWNGISWCLSRDDENCIVIKKKQKKKKIYEAD